MLSSAFLECGILQQRSIDPNRCDRELAEIFVEGVEERFVAVPIEKERHVLRVAVENVTTFLDELEPWLHVGIVEPVWVPDRESLENYRANLYCGLEVRRTLNFEDVNLNEDCSPERLEEAEFRRALERLQESDHYRMEYFSGWRGGLRIWLNRSEALISGSWLTLPGAGGLRVELVPGVWEKVEKLTDDESIWRNDSKKLGFDGEDWSLERAGENPRKVALWCPDACPLVDFSFELMRLVGLEPQVKRYVSWR